MHWQEEGYYPLQNTLPALNLKEIQTAVNPASNRAVKCPE